MAYSTEFRPHVEKTLKKVAKRDPTQYDAVMKKIVQISEDPNRFKPLKGRMKNT